MRFFLLVAAFLACSVAACRRQADTTSGPSLGGEPAQAPVRQEEPLLDAAKTTRPAQRTQVTWDEPPDPLAAEAKSMPIGQARIKLIRSQPAGPASKQAKFEWAILERVSASAIKLPKGFEPGGSPQEVNKPGWVIHRLIVRVEVESKGQGQRCLVGRIRRKSVFFLPGLQVGHSMSEFPGPFGRLVYEKNAAHYLAINDKDGRIRPTPTVEMTKAQVDEEVQVLFKGPEAIGPAKTLEMLRIGKQLLTLEIAGAQEKKGT
jgi:hypothetical protein